jgi:hypothetical protein
MRSNPGCHPGRYGAGHGSRAADTERPFRTNPEPDTDELAQWRTVHSPPVSDPQEEPAAVRDARLIANSIAQDEADSDAARLRYQTDGLPVVESETGFTPLALPGEVLHALRENALLERTLPDAPEPSPQAGTLYLSSERLVHVGALTTSIQLGKIEEMSVALQRLLLIQLDDGTHLAIDTDQPRLLRVQVAAALAAARLGAAAEGTTNLANSQTVSQTAG